MTEQRVEEATTNVLELVQFIKAFVSPKDVFSDAGTREYQWVDCRRRVAYLLMVEGKN